MKTLAITAERVRELLDYDPKTGCFTWRSRSNGRVPAGSIAGALNGTGYVTIKIDRTSHQAHRLAWLWVHGRLPVQQIDHINRNRSDNRIANLRDVSMDVNMQNKPVRSDSVSGVTGVAFHRGVGKWVARIQRFRQMVHLGVFDTKEAAVAARQAAEVQA